MTTKASETGKEQPKTKLDALEETVVKMIDMLEELAKRIEKVEKTAVKKSTGLFGGKRTRTAIKDTKTGAIYVSKAAVGKNLAGEFNLDPLDHFAWYKITALEPDRFVEAGEEEAQKVWKEEEEKRAKEVEESNKRLAAEEAAKAKK